MFGFVARLGVVTALDAAVAIDPAAPQIQALRVPVPTQQDAGQTPATPTTTSTPSAPSSQSPQSGPRAQNLVPVYRTAALTRSEVKQINRVAGEITTADLAELARRADAGTKPRDLAAGWLGEHGL